MPSDKTHERRPRHERSPSPTPASNDDDLPRGVSPISESDYFLKNTEFRIWLKEEKHKVCPALGFVESRDIINCRGAHSLSGSTLTSSRARRPGGESR